MIVLKGKIKIRKGIAPSVNYAKRYNYLPKEKQKYTKAVVRFESTEAKKIDFKSFNPW